MELEAPDASPPLQPAPVHTPHLRHIHASPLLQPAPVPTSQREKAQAVELEGGRTDVLAATDAQADLREMPAGMEGVLKASNEQDEEDERKREPKEHRAASSGGDQGHGRHHHVGGERPFPHGCVRISLDGTSGKYRVAIIFGPDSILAEVAHGLPAEHDQPTEQDPPAEQDQPAEQNPPCDAPGSPVTIPSSGDASGAGASHLSTPAVCFEPVDAEALHTFKLLDADESGSVDLEELRHAVQKLETVGLLKGDIASGLLVAIDVNADGRLARAEWMDHFREMARTNGRPATLSYLRKIDACAILQQPLNISVESVHVQLRKALTANFARVMDLFRIWDTDGNGLVSLREFRKAIRALRLSASDAEVDSLFATWDRDGSGSISSRELSKILRRGAGAEIELAPDLQPGAAGEIELESKNAIALRKSQRDGPRARTGIAPTIANIKAAMSEDRWRTRDMMNVLDRDEDGRVTKREFLSVLPVLGFDAAESDELLQLFLTIDADASGSVDFDELHAALRKELGD